MNLKRKSSYIIIIVFMMITLILLIKFSDKFGNEDYNIVKVQNCDNSGDYAVSVSLNKKRITLQFDNQKKSIYISKSQGFVIPNDSGVLVKTSDYKKISDTIIYFDRSRYCNYVNVVDNFIIKGNVFSSSESFDSFEVKFYFLNNNDPSNNFEKVAVENVFDNVRDFNKISPNFNKMLFEVIDIKEFYSFFGLSHNYNSE